MDTKLKCIICGNALYNTDRCLNEFSYHCSSSEARFWDFERGTTEQLEAKDHWDKSKQEIPTHPENKTPS